MPFSIIDYNALTLNPVLLNKTEYDRDFSQDAYIQKHLIEHGGIVLLDGLDEVPEARKRRKALIEAIFTTVQEDTEK